jgi:Domain of unknown function (DUF4397)
MKLRTRVVLQLAALCLCLGAYGFAANNAYLYVVHAIPGRDIADNLNPGYPIDVLINGKDCLVRNLTFGNTAGPYTLAAGTYTVEISESNTLAPCTNPAVISSSITFKPGDNTSAVAAINANQPTLVTLSDDLGAVVPGHARFVFANVGDAPELQATLTQLYVKTPQTFTVTASPGTENWIGIPDGTYSVQITESGSTTVLTSENITLQDQSVTLAYAAGEALNNTVGLVTKVVRDVF